MSSGLSVSKSLGMHGHWGLSACFDILEATQTSNIQEEDIEEQKPIRVLLMNPGDIRHIICTVSRRLRQEKGSKKKRPIHFYLFENPLEILTRDLILLELFHDFEVPIRQRATIFLEVFGNMNVQKRTNIYLEQLALRVKQLLVKNDGYLENLYDWSCLGFRERDLLEQSLKFYDRSAAVSMDSWFDHRKRGLYAERYDSRTALYDWDYHSCFKTRASIIHIKQYKTWRDKGIAFEFGDQDYCEANKTLVSYAEGFLKQGKDKGLKKEVMGFWGDIVCSPFIPFGIDCETPNSLAEGLFEILNKNTGTEQHRHHAVELALYNLFSYMWEMETGSIYRMTRKNDVYSGLGRQGAAVNKDQVEKQSQPEENEENKSKEDDDPNTVFVDEPSPESNKVKELSDEAEITQNPSVKNEESVLKAIETMESICECLDGVKIFPMLGSSSKLLSKSKFEGLFDFVFISSRYGQVASEDFISGILAPNAIIALETSKFLIPLSGEVKSVYLEKLDEFANKNNWSKMQKAPVYRRRRDENDSEDDVVFYRVSA